MRHAIGVDIGGSNIRAAVVSEQGDIVDRRSISTPKSVDAVLGQTRALIESLGHHAAHSIGIGIPGRVNGRAGIVLSGGFVDLSGLSIEENLTPPGKHRVLIDNDANMALRGEARLGAARGVSNVVLLTIGTGIGGAIMEDGRIIHGRATAGQLGHVTIDLNGLACLCGRRGCVETASSGTALGRLVREAGLDPRISIEELLARTDETARGICTAWASPLRAAIDSLVAVLDPECVVLGGGLGRAAAKAVAAIPAASQWYQSSVVAAELGDDAGVIGAALASLEQVP